MNNLIQKEKLKEEAGENFWTANKYFESKSVLLCRV